MSSPTTPDFILRNIPLADKNWFGTGGHARFYTRPSNYTSFAQALEWANTNNQPIVILGEGANILISDEGFNGLVIHPALSTLEVLDQSNHHASIRAGAGLSFKQLILWCLDNNYTGLEEFSGIPGTVGGAVFINIHFFEFLLDQFLESATIINHQTGTIKQVERDWFAFKYNYSRLHEQEWYLLDAVFKVKRVSEKMAEYARGRHDEMIRYRARRYPQKGTCGSFFRNFYPHEVTLEQQGKKIIYIAYYLDILGIKGQLTFGDAQVSVQHANMIINTGNARSQDIITVASLMQKKVYDTFGLLPEPECRLIGFSEYPLFTPTVITDQYHQQSHLQKKLDVQITSNAPVQ